MNSNMSQSNLHQSLSAFILFHTGSSSDFNNVSDSSSHSSISASAGDEYNPQDIHVLLSEYDSEQEAVNHLREPIPVSASYGAQERRSSHGRYANFGQAEAELLEAANEETFVQVENNAFTETYSLTLQVYSSLSKSIMLCSTKNGFNAFKILSALL